MTEPVASPESSASRPPANCSAAVVEAGLWRGALIGVAVPALPVFVLGFPASIVVVPVALLLLGLPVFLVQFITMELAPRWVVKRSWRVVALVLVSHLLSIASWTLLWSIGQYGSAWPAVLQYLLLLHALPATVQATVVIRRQLQHNKPGDQRP